MQSPKPLIFKLALLLLVFTGFYSPVLAQREFSDSVLKRFLTEKSDTEQVRLLIQAANRLPTGDTLERMRCLQRVDSIARKTGKPFFTAQYHFFKGTLLITTDQYQAINELETAVRALSAFTGNRRAMSMLWSSYINLGVIHANNQDYTSALDYYRQAEPLILKYDPSNSDLGLLYSNMSISYGSLNRTEEGQLYSKKGLERARGLADKFQLMAAYYAHGGNLAAKPKGTEALLLLDSAMMLANQLEDANYQYMIHNLKGTYYYNTKQFGEALKEYTQCLEIVRKFNFTYGIGISYLNMAAQEAELKMPRLAGAHLDSVARYIDLNPPTAAKQMYFENYAEVYRQLGMFDKAFSYKDTVGVIKDSVYNADNVRQMEFRRARYNYEKTQNDNFRLEKEKELQALSIRQKNLVNGLLAGGLLAAAIIGFLFYRNSRNKQLLQQQQIQALQQEKQLLATEAVLKGEEQERARLARDLHDGLGGMLSGIKFSLNNIKGNLILSPENADSFDKSIDMLNSSIQEMRRVAHNMMPEALVKFGLDTALRDFCDQLNQSGSIPVTYQSVSLSGSPIDQTVSLNLFRIIQELINNSLKHAEANTILVQVIRTGDRLSITVEDDGKGFNITGPELKNGIGWQNIHNRVDFLKADLDLSSQPGSGTSVLISVTV